MKISLTTLNSTKVRVPITKMFRVWSATSESGRFVTDVQFKADKVMLVKETPLKSRN